MKQLLPLLILFSFSVQAQELLHCGADEMRIETLQANPKIAKAVIEMLTYGKTLCVDQSAVKLSLATDRVIYEWKHHSLPNMAKGVLYKKTY